MLPIAADIAVRLTREQAQSALPDAPVVPDPVRARRQPRRRRSQRVTAVALRRLSATSSGLADRIDRRTPARQ
jgi:hypothetical protein